MSKDEENELLKWHLERLDSEVNMNKEVGSPTLVDSVVRGLMTVSEIIEELQKFPQDAAVFARDAYGSIEPVSKIDYINITDRCVHIYCG